MTGDLSDETTELTVEARAHGWRIDHYLVRLFPNYSRALFQKAIEQQAVFVNGLPVKPSRRLRVNDRVSVRLPEIPDESVPAEDIPIDVLYEDDSLVVINKQAGMIVHPGRGNVHGTLAGALQFHFDELSETAGKLRPGIVHRLDRDTTGVLVIAKNNQVHHRLSGQFERREVTKEYRAIVWNVPQLDRDFIETHIRVNPRHREKMAVCGPGGNAREAVTFYEVLERFRGFSLMRLLPKTGRTHQLRVHMQHLGHAIVADRAYGARRELWLSDLLESGAGGSSAIEERGGSNQTEPDNADPLIDRQALHALRLEFCHPQDGRRLAFEAPLPDDFVRALDAIRKYRPA